MLLHIPIFIIFAQFHLIIFAMMNNIETNNKTNFRKLAFRFFIYALLINSLAFYLTINYTNFTNDVEDFKNRMVMISVVGNVIVVLGSLFTYISFKNKEERNYQFYIAFFGYPFMLLLTIASWIF